MGCLAKCYSNEAFDVLWVGKSRFDNTGNSTLTDYRVTLPHRRLQRLEHVAAQREGLSRADRRRSLLSRCSTWKSSGC